MTKILSGAFIERRELLPDNLMLRRQLHIQDEFTPSPRAAKPPLREVQTIPSRVCCVASYLMVLASAGKLRPDHLAYLRLIVEPKRPSSKATGGRHTMPPSAKNMAARASGLYLGLRWTPDCTPIHAAHRLAVHHIEAYHVAQDCALSQREGQI